MLKIKCRNTRNVSSWKKKVWIVWTIRKWIVCEHKNLFPGFYKKKKLNRTEKVWLKILLYYFQRKYIWMDRKIGEWKENHPSTNINLNKIYWIHTDFKRFHANFFRHFSFLSKIKLANSELNTKKKIDAVKTWRKRYSKSFAQLH